MKLADDVPNNKVFHLGEKKISNVYGLLFELRSMTNDSYSHYAGHNHNYFADWIEHVYEFKALATELRKAQDRKGAIELIEKALDSDKPKQKIHITQPKIVAKKEKPQKDKEKPKEEIKKEKAVNSFVVSDSAEEHITLVDEPKASSNYGETEIALKKIAEDEAQIKEFLWKHFGWDMAKEFMYGLAIGILVGFILSRIFLPS